MGNNDKTQVFNYGNTAKSDNDKTEHISKAQHFSSNTDKTMIVGAGNEGNSTSSAKRKLVGWLVSFTLDEAGTDFRLFEGKNKLGRNLSNDIRIFQDPKISGEHATLLIRGTDLFVKDEMASNPSFHNGSEIMPGQTVAVKDGDTLRFGDNEFIFRKACI